MNSLSTLSHKVFGGIKMTWAKTIIAAVIAGLATGGIVLCPAFSGTSIENIGVCFEAWVMLALFIVLNCEKPLEAAEKTFVFFLISQPLVYLIQVPFCDAGWGIFQYYKYWAIWTVLTFPGAFIAWYVKKGNSLSVAIFAVAEFLLACEFGWSGGHLQTMLNSFPHQLIACLFILFEIVFFGWLFFSDKKLRITSWVLGLVMILGVVLFTSNLILSHSKDISFWTEGTVPATIVSVDDGCEVEKSDDLTITGELTKPGDYHIIYPDASGVKYDQEIIYEDDGTITYVGAEKVTE